MSLIGSCNGFICLLHGSIHDENHSIYISNPLLAEYFKLKLPEWEKSICRVVYGFFFSDAFGRYKVLRLEVNNFADRVLKYQIWRLLLLELMRIREMWAIFPILYGMTLAMLMSMVIFIR